ncbi:MAG: STAS domain-containing protein [Betaproteobacteria bacterium]|nr:STAS domain-containing protein [Betaproteobacteria bacterium]
MTNANSGAGGTSLLRIEGEMTIYRALELKQALLDRLKDSAAVEIDLAGVTEFDTAGVQLLLLAKKAAQVRQRELRLVAQSPAVAEVLELLNLATDFGDPRVMSSASA